jgi:hypothetical protein
MQIFAWVPCSQMPCQLCKMLSKPWTLHMRRLRKNQAVSRLIWDLAVVSICRSASTAKDTAWDNCHHRLEQRAGLVSLSCLHSHAGAVSALSLSHSLSLLVRSTGTEARAAIDFPLPSSCGWTWLCHLSVYPDTTPPCSPSCRRCR